MGKAIYLRSRLAGMWLCNMSGAGKNKRNIRNHKHEKTLPNAMARSYYNKRSSLHLVEYSHGFENKKKRKEYKGKGKEAIVTLPPSQDWSTRPIVD